MRSVYAQPRERRVARRVAVPPTWPGGSAPVRVALEVDADGQALQSTLALPLDRWQTVARSGGPVGAATPGTVSSADAAGQPARELLLLRRHNDALTLHTFQTMGFTCRMGCWKACRMVTMSSPKPSSTLTLRNSGLALPNHTFTSQPGRKTGASARCVHRRTSTT